MKKFTIKKALRAIDIGDENPKLTGFEIEGGEEMECSDGYHTFSELYEHRIELFIALCGAYLQINEEWGANGRDVWKSKLHSDGTSFDGWFILGIGTEKGGQITYHLPNSYWKEAPGKILERAPEWDGHTPQDVLERIKNL